jgi:hypothetical protein
LVTRRPWALSLLLPLLVVLFAGPAARGQSVRPEDPALQSARLAYDATDYEGARAALDAIVTGLTGQELTPGDRDLLAAAYELRGRTLQNLRDIEGARADFRLMLLLRPDYPFPAEAGARALALFEEVRAATVGFVEIDAAPADARILVDDRPVERPARVWLVDGAHTVTVERRGYATVTQTFAVRPGEPNEVSVTLERIASTLMVVTIPGDVEVVLNGAPRGRTRLADGTVPVSPDAPAALTAAPASSQPLLIEDLPLGVHTLEFRRACFVTHRRTVDITQHGEIRLEPVRLEPAVGTIAVRSNRPDASVFLDGAARGEAPQTVTACEGRRVVEVRTASGRDVRRYDLTAGAKEEWTARIRPAVALIGGAGTVTAAQLEEVEAAFSEAATLKLYVPAPAAAGVAEKQLPEGWPSWADPRRPAAADAAARRQAVAEASGSLQAQGVATVLPGSTAGETRLLLLAPGSTAPDVIMWGTGDRASVRTAVEQLDARPALARPSLGIVAIDVLDVEGVVIASVEAGGAAAAAGLRRGDTVISAGGSAVANVAALDRLAAAQPPQQPLALQVRDAAGTVRAVTVAVTRQPRVVDPADDAVLANVLAIDLSARLPSASAPLERAGIGLNLAAAWLQLENLPAATQVLEEVLATADGILLGPARDAVTGTAQYLLGLAAAQSGDTSAARRAWAAASASTADLLTGGAVPVKELAARALRSLPQP